MALGHERISFSTYLKIYDATLVALENRVSNSSFTLSSLFEERVTTSFSSWAISSQQTLHEDVDDH